jgi:hypothetical protein
MSWKRTARKQRFIVCRRYLASRLGSVLLTLNQGALNNTFSSKAHRLSTVRFVNVLQLNETLIVLAVVLVLQFAGGLYFFTLRLN